MTGHDIVDPVQLAKAQGFSHGVLATPGRLLFVAGQIGWDSNARLVSSEFGPQFEQALQNVVAVVTEAGGRPQHLTRLTIYVTDKRRYLAVLKDVGAGYRRQMGRHYPAMALIEVQDLLEEGALVEIEGTAVLPTDPGGAPGDAP